MSDDACYGKLPPAEKQEDFRTVYRFLAEDLEENPDRSVIKQLHLCVTGLPGGKEELTNSQCQKITEETLLTLVNNRVANRNKLDELTSTISRLMYDPLDKGCVFLGLKTLFTNEDIAPIAPYDPTIDQAAW